MSIGQSGQQKISELVSAIGDKITSLISTHNTDNTAHSDIRTTVNNKENISNKVTSLSSSSTDNQYPSAKCVFDSFEDIVEVVDEGTTLTENGIYLIIPSTNLPFSIKISGNNHMRLPMCHSSSMYSQTKILFDDGNGGTKTTSVVDWGDGTTEQFTSTTQIFHTYADNESEHIITFEDDVVYIGGNYFLVGGEASSYADIIDITLPNTLTELGSYVFASSFITSLELPSSITTIGDGCFENCDSLTSVKIPSNCSLGSGCFFGCDNLIDYQLYWTGNDIVAYSSYDMKTNADTIFTIPNGETSNYIAKGYPSERLQERSA